jgi:hypothetical protein
MRWTHYVGKYVDSTLPAIKLTQGFGLHNAS